VNELTRYDDSRYFSYPLIKKDALEFRTYQDIIFKSVRNKNALVILPTSLGKTAIAILLCAEFLHKYKSKRVLIMAPTKPLVAQHMGSFFSLLRIPEDIVAIVSGKNQPQSRLAIWNNGGLRLVFATPEVVRNDLVENRLSLAEFSLLVFDEAHRAVKDYAYTSIARYYLQQSSNPTIFAMTASPGSERGRVKEVCNNLSIEQIEYRNEEDPTVKPYVNPIQTTWQWFTIPQEYKYISSIFRSMLEEKLRFLIERGLLRKKNPNWIFKRDLINLGEEIQYKIELTMEELRGPLYSALMQQSSALTLTYCAELIESQGSQSLRAFLNRIENDAGKAHLLLLNDRRIKEIRTFINAMKLDHPKMTYLIHLLKQHYSQPNEKDNNMIAGQEKQVVLANERPKVLVFAHYRDTAKRIVETLNENGLQAVRFVGQARRELDMGMNQEEQSAVLESFRNGEFDILVATSIAEEGLDIPQVGLVVFYEPIPSEIRYIQRRGRTGRKSAGTVVILATKNTLDERYLYASKRRIEKMKQILSSLSSSLTPIRRTISLPNPMTSEEISSYESRRKVLDGIVDKTLSSQHGISTDDLIQRVTFELNAKLARLKDKSKMDLLSIESYTLTNEFKKQVDSASRRIHQLVAKSGTQGLDVDTIKETYSIDNSVLLEALKRLEKLKRIEWIGDDRVILSENTVKVSGSTYGVHVVKIIHGGALVIVNDKWHARLNHYDYEGPRELLRKGSEFRAIGELYRDGDIFSLRIKQIV
jgi:Fanconi anemia group M protein